VRTYLTVNTIIFDEEIPKLHSVIDHAKEAGITAIIASDLAAITYARQVGVEVHISTQVNVTNIEAVRFYSRFANVMVLAREMTLDKVAKVTEQIREQQINGPDGKPVRLEMFVHGALCMAVSGKCYLSLHEMNASANRGNCFQICRRGYTVTDKGTGAELDIENEYIMSPKDLKTIHFLNKILDSGVTVLKIEGRARSAEYVKTVVECYHEAVNAYFEKTFTEEKIADWDSRLTTVFNRGFWDGYYLGQRLGEWSKNYGSSATKQKLYIGRVDNYFSNIGVAECKIDTHDISVGDEILIVGPTTGVVKTTVTEIRVDLNSTEKVTKGEVCSIPVADKVRRSDKIYRFLDIEA
jgi:putative protease